MRLTNYLRGTIRYRVINDIPIVDYETLMQSRINEICITLMPPEIRKLWTTAKFRGYLRTGRYYYCCNTFTTPGFDRDDDCIAAIKADAPLAELHALKDAQTAQVESIREKLRINLALCTTDKQFHERFPELEKYAPRALAVTANLPATTDLIDSLRAAGVQLEPEPVQ